MSSPKLNLPMLSAYLLGEVMSSHDGVSCYPAIRRGTDEKYIVKVISIPASQSKLDALLLTGAMANKEAALEYFMALSKDVINQTDILRQLSHQEGFVPYLDGQIVPMESDVGYEVCLLGTYKHSLERILRTDVMTHADVANLGLDLCAALAACRRTGYLYADLKPGNIFRDPEQGFRIGDVGFIALPSLKYASLPEKYRSSYTAPELQDDMAVLNSTVDIYALGLVLYQAYNGGVLPFEGEAPAEMLPPPIYADYEMAEIILKACHPDPKERWQEPTKMAHALIDYLQTYGAPEAPIIPPVLDIPEAEEEEKVEEFLPEADPAQLQQELEDLENADPDELAFLSGLVSDETAPNEENTADVPDEVMTQELSEMFAQADELICHELPEPPVAPEPIFVPMPEPIVLEDETEEAPEEAEVETEDAPCNEAPAEAQEQAEEAAAAEEEPPVVDAAAESQPHEPSASPSDAQTIDPEAQPLHEKPILRRIVTAAVVILLLIGGWFFGQRYYNDYYLLTVDGLVLNNDKNTLTVQVLSDIDEQLLTVICTDSYGNSTTSAVSGGIATFTNLNPNTRYTVRVEASGHHKLIGTITDSFTTAAQTQILSFTAGIGPEDCSVALNFTVSGPETGSWTVLYSADGIAEQALDFTGRSVVVTDLVPGALYTFTLTSPDGLYMAGQTQAQYLATDILYAQNLTITACGGGSLTAQWQQSDDGTVTEWRVRCFNEAGYNVTVTTTDLSYTFTDLDHATACTVEVTAVGMNRSVSTTISANPVTVENFACHFTQDMVLQATWEYSGQAPAGGWILRYRLNGGEEKALILEGPTANILAIPGGSYSFTIETADGSFVFNSSHSYTAAEISIFSAYGISAIDMDWKLCLWLDGDDWDQADLPTENYKTEFAFDEKAGFVIALGVQAEASKNTVNVQFVLHDASGKALRLDSASLVWDAMWDGGYCLLPIPAMPETAGSYTLTMYFDGCFVWQQELTVLSPIINDDTQTEGTVI